MEKFFTEYSRIDLDMGRLNALVDLFNACKEQGVEIRRVVFTMNGYAVLFKDLHGDAILHDGSYGRLNNEWETCKMPWDCDDVSVHDTKTLAKLLGALSRGENWEIIENTEDEDKDDVVDFNFISDYSKLTALLKMQAARDMKKEERYGG